MKKKIVILSLISLLLLPLANFNIKAEGTYINIDANNCTDVGQYQRTRSGTTKTFYTTVISSAPTRFLVFKYNNNFRYYLWSDKNFKYYIRTDESYSCNISASMNSSSYNGKYYEYDGGISNWNSDTLSNITYENVIELDHLPNYIEAYEYAYGQYAEDPTTPINYGQIDNLKYYSNLLTSNPAGNVDTIYWNGYQDTNGNDITGLKIEIKAESGYFTAQDRPSLLQETFANWIRDNKPSVTIYKGTTLQEKVAVEWQTVANKFKQNTETLGQFFWSIFAKEGWYYQYGWRYYARLLDENEDPISEWQELIQATSYTPQATETLTDDEPLTPDDVDTINDINNQNNTTNNWYVNNTVINNNEYNNTYQQNIIENIYNILQGTPDGNNQQLATDTQNTVDNAIDTENDYTNQLQNQLNNLELNDISQNNGLIKALRWVREVHKETIEDTVFGEIVLTVMLIGLITYLIGRRNG